MINKSSKPHSHIGCLFLPSNKSTSLELFLVKTLSIRPITSMKTGFIAGLLK